MQPSRDIARLIEIMAALRTPGTGCPWDLEQTFATIAPYTLEEAYEVADAIARADLPDLKEELGDLLLQVVFHARLAEEEGTFAFPDVVEAITSKLVRRHPHVFGDARDLSPEAVKGMWTEIKAQEKAERAAARAAAGLAPEEGVKGTLSGVALPLPALTRALKLQEKASRVGFDWNDARQVLAKIREETEEVSQALDAGGTEAIRDEIGDLLFAVVNLARHADVDPETALRGTNEKFTRRFGHVETQLAADGRRPNDASLDEMEALWQDAKRLEKQSERAAE
ncbi:nucleoside triphosphate pyrophosphohydrolase [Xanthobacter sp. 126]|uniref:nucleoside triphosphate pyrophosphohydrolase n=1 Tax=Xanthobacter sp. 126 TaxID=1131814 RepID=UPI00045E734C|nr:nucleoside triphosphate pyrophosphohydrolase [Xanthobacter sp. 126]